MPDQQDRPKRAYRRTSETQQIIFDTAMRLMSERGFQGTTIRDICTGAGIPIGTFYNCYKSKFEILKRIYDDGDAFIQTSCARDGTADGAQERLRAFARYYAQLNEKTGIDVLRVLFYPSNEWFTMERPMQVYAKRIIQAGQESGEIQGALSPEEIVGSLFDILRGVSYNWCVCGGSFDLKKRIDFHMELFCAAIENTHI